MWRNNQFAWAGRNPGGGGGGDGDGGDSVDTLHRHNPGHIVHFTTRRIDKRKKNKRTSLNVLRWDYGGTRGTWLCMLPVSRELGAENVWVEEEKSKFERAWNQSRMPTREIRKTNRTSIERNEKEEKKRNENWGWPVREMKMRHSSCCNKNVADLLLRKRIMTSAYTYYTHTHMPSSYSSSSIELIKLTVCFARPPGLEMQLHRLRKQHERQWR